jgi:hypothetical protein
MTFSLGEFFYSIRFKYHQNYGYQQRVRQIIQTLIMKSNRFLLGVIGTPKIPFRVVFFFLGEFWLLIDRLRASQVRLATSEKHFLDSFGIEFGQFKNKMGLIF